MTTKPEVSHADHDAKCRIAYSSESRLQHLGTFFQNWFHDLRAAGPTAHRFFKRSLTQRYRMSSLGVAWAFAPSVITAIVLIAGQRTSLLGQSDQSTVPSAFYGVFGLAVAQTFLEALNGLRVLFTNHQHMLRRKNVPLEGLILAAFIEIFFNTLIRLVVLTIVFFLFGVAPKLMTLPIAIGGLFGVMLIGGGLGLLIAPLNSLRSDIDQVIHLLPWMLFAVTPVFVAPSAGTILERIYQLNPLAWLFDSIRTTAYGASGSLYPALLGPFIGLFLIITGWFICRFCRPYIVERYLV